MKNIHGPKSTCSRCGQEFSRLVYIFYKKQTNINYITIDLMYELYIYIYLIIILMILIYILPFCFILEKQTLIFMNEYASLKLVEKGQMKSNLGLEAKEGKLTYP